jgi:hypothetical protein
MPSHFRHYDLHRQNRAVRDTYHSKVDAMVIGTNSAESGLVRDAYHYKFGVMGIGTTHILTKSRRIRANTRCVPLQSRAIGISTTYVPFRRAYHNEERKIGTSRGCVPFQSLYYYEGAYKGPVQMLDHYEKCIIRTITESLPVRKGKRSPNGLLQSVDKSLCASLCKQENQNSSVLLSDVKKMLHSHSV